MSVRQQYNAPNKTTQASIHFGTKGPRTTSSFVSCVNTVPAVHKNFPTKVLLVLHASLRWLYLLPAEVKNFADALTALAQLTLPSAIIADFTPKTPIEANTVLRRITPRASLELRPSKRYFERPVPEGTNQTGL